MKNLKTGTICLLLILCASGAFAQPAIPGRTETLKKPQLFNDLPPRISLNRHVFAQLLDKEMGAEINFPLAAGITFSGVVVSKSNAAEKRSKTVVIRSSDRPGAAFTITRLEKSDGSIRYSGRMLSLKYSDAYEMVEEDGEFALQKTRLDELVIE